MRSRSLGRESGVSPVVAIVGMVAMALVAAGAAWMVSSYGGSGDSAGDRGVNVSVGGHDVDVDGMADWIRLTLERSPGPLAAKDLEVSVVVGDEVLEGLVCRTPELNGSRCEEPQTGPATWVVGQALFVPCEGNASHQVLAWHDRVRVLTGAVACRERSVGVS